MSERTKYKKVLHLPMPCKPVWMDKPSTGELWLEAESIKWYERKLFNFWRITTTKDIYEKCEVKSYLKKNGIRVLLSIKSLPSSLDLEKKQMLV